MNYTDIFRKTFLEGYSTANISIINVVLTITITSLIGMYLFVVHRLLTRKTFYDKAFSLSLPTLAIITAAVIMTIQSSIVISLGMVGALSIVRFRTAIKSPMDLVFLFWAIAIGIICGAGFAEIAIIISVFLTVGIFLLDRIPVIRSSQLLVISADDYDVEDELITVVKDFCKYYKIKSRNLSEDNLDIIIEVRVKDDGALVKEVFKLNGIKNASLLTHDGEVSF